MKSDDRPPEFSDRDGISSEIPPMGTLVIRTWHEAGHVQGFRARLTYSREPDGEPNTISTADPGEALSIVRRWLFAQSGLPGDV